jgi:uncharacterized protein with HEPN domain
MKDEFRDYLQDILNEITSVEEFVAGLDYKGFAPDKKTANAVIRSLEVIGEASKNIPKSVKQRHKDIPWKEMSGMRDKLIHGYFGVDLEVVWVVATEELPLLKKRIKQVIEEEKG